MPVTTRSKRKTVDNSDIQERPTKLLIKLVDVTNKKNKNNGKLDKNQIFKTKSDDSIIKKVRSDDVKMSNSIIRPHFTTNSIPSQNFASQSSSEDFLKTMRKVKQVLGTYFKSASSRLQLDIIPDCLYDIKLCHQKHKNNIARQAQNESKFVAKLYLAEERHFQFFQHIRRNMIASNLFPGTKICISIFKEIMKFKSKDPNFSTQFALSELYNVFITILNTFPPCYIQDSYLKLFTSKVQFDGLPEKRDILPTILDTIHDLIFDNENDKFDNSVNIDFNKNFYLWDEDNESSAFIYLSRDDRFKRAFMILDLIIRVLEYDTALFLTKYSYEFASAIKQKGVKPIICSLIWQGLGDIMTVNAIVKKIISIYIAMNALDYPADKIRIVSRLLNLIVNVINSYEYSEDLIQNPKNLTSNVVNEIRRMTENSSYISMDLWLKVIENLRSPLIRMMLSNHLYSKVVGQTFPVSLAVPFKAVYSKDFLKFDSVVATEHFQHTEKYSRYDNQRISSNESKISQNNFIKLLMLYTDAVIRNFHLHDIVKEMKNSDDQVQDMDVEMKPAIPHKFNLANFQREIKKIDLNEKVTLRTVDLNFKNAAHVRLNRDNCSFYRNEIKNFPLFIRLIERCHEKYGLSFAEWLESLKKVQ